MLQPMQISSQKEQYVINTVGIRRLAGCIRTIKKVCNINEAHPILTLVANGFYHRIAENEMVLGTLFGDHDRGVLINGKKYEGLAGDFQQYLTSNLHLSDEQLKLLLNSPDSGRQGYGYHQGLVSVFYNAIVISLPPPTNTYSIYKKLHLNLYYNSNERRVFFDVSYSDISIARVSDDSICPILLTGLELTDRLTSRFVFTDTGFQLQEVFATNRALLRLGFGFHDLDPEKVFQADAENKRIMGISARKLYALRQFNPERLDKLTIEQVFKQNVRVRDDTGRLPWLDNQFLLPAVPSASQVRIYSSHIIKTATPAALPGFSPKMNCLLKRSPLPPPPSPTVWHPLCAAGQQLARKDISLPSPPFLPASPILPRKTLLNSLQQDEQKTSLPLPSSLLCTSFKKHEAPPLVVELGAPSPSSLLFPSSPPAPRQSCYSAVATPSAPKPRSIFSFDDAAASSSSLQRFFLPRFPIQQEKPQAKQTQLKLQEKLQAEQTQLNMSKLYRVLGITKQR